MTILIAYIIKVVTKRYLSDQKTQKTKCYRLGSTAGQFTKTNQLH